MDNVARKLPAPMTVDEFLDWPGDGTNTRYELVDGLLRAQEYPSDAHGLIHSNLVIVVGNHLREVAPRCNVVIGGGVRPHLRADWNFRVPDIALTCSPNRSGVRDVPLPVVLIEILSAGNSVDTWDNVRNYVTIPSVKEIVLISSFSINAHVLARDGDGHWPKNPTDLDKDGTLGLASVGFAMPLIEAYRDTYLLDPV
jgi:Uma2 family endonuclease